MSENSSDRSGGGSGDNLRLSDNQPRKSRKTPSTTPTKRESRTKQELPVVMESDSIVPPSSPVQRKHRRRLSNRDEADTTPSSSSSTSKITPPVKRLQLNPKLSSSSPVLPLDTLHPGSIKLRTDSSAESEILKGCSSSSLSSRDYSSSPSISPKSPSRSNRSISPGRAPTNDLQETPISMSFAGCLSPITRGRLKEKKNSLGKSKMQESIMLIGYPDTSTQDQDQQNKVSGNLRGLKKSHSDPFLNSWEYGNLEADFMLPNGDHISAHYDILQGKRARARRREMIKEDRANIPSAASFLRLPEINLKFTNSPKENQDVVYENDDTLVVAGTASKLFYLLADHRIQDKEYIEIYLATHLRFITTAELINNLLDYFRDPLSATNAKLTPEEAAEYKALIQVRIVNVFKKWLRYHYAYEFEDPIIAAQVEGFITELNRSKNSEHKQWSQFLETSWQRRKFTNFEAFEFDEDAAPKPILPSTSQASDLSFLDCNPTELARQLTLIHQSMFQRIRNNHLLKFLKNKDDPDNPVGEISAFSAKIIDWVGSEITSTPTVKKRAQVVSNFIKLAIALKNMSNYHGALDVYLPLSGYNMAKLRKTWKALDSSAKDKFKTLTELFDPTGGLKNLRKTIKEASAPLIIPPNIWLHDLIMVDENDDYWSDEATPRTPVSSRSSKDRLINFQKLRLLCKTFGEVYRCQLEPFNFSEVPVIRDYLQNHLETISNEELEIVISNLVTSQEGKKEEISMTAKPPKNKDKLTRMSSLGSLFRIGKITSPNAKKE